MRHLLYILFSLSFCSFYDYKIKNEDCYIEWKDKKLTSEDFKGKIIHKNAVASTVYCLHKEIKLQTNGSINANIKAYFICSKSWMLKDNCGDDVVKHEQKHFDIAEIFARKLRKQLRAIEIKDYKDAEHKLDSVYKIIAKEMDVYQDNYDKETDHSLLIKEQKKWNNKIAFELYKLKRYRETEFELKKQGNSNLMVFKNQTL